MTLAGSINGDVARMTPTSSTEVPSLVDHLFRHAAGQAVATLARLLGPHRIDLAEDAFQETLVKALREWPARGIPDNPEGWILAVARNHALDVLRRERAFAGKRDKIARTVVDDAESGDPAVTAEELDHALRADHLRMMFTCCHPAFAPETRVALTLKLLGGFGVREIARAFLTPEATIAQRLVRAKRSIKTGAVAFATPFGLGSGRPVPRLQ